MPNAVEPASPVISYRQKVLRDLGFNGRQRAVLIERIEHSEIRLEEVREAVVRGCSITLAFRIYR